jgi:putative glycerol-1-phosphate prenyltransferase
VKGILNKIIKNKKKPLLAILIDPDKFNPEVVIKSSDVADFFLLGGSSLENGQLSKCLIKIKKLSKLPVIIFPGDTNQLNKKADATLLLSLISGKNPDYLIGKHIDAAYKLKSLKHELIPTGYLLIDGGNVSTTQKVTKTLPISINNLDLIKRIVIAGELLGLKMIYLEAGSGAEIILKNSIVRAVKKVTTLPVCIGGGINSINKYLKLQNSGADVIVIGNALEKNLSLIDDLKHIKK